MNATIYQWRYGQAYGEDLFQQHRRRPRQLAPALSRRRRGARHAASTATTRSAPCSRPSRACWPTQEPQFIGIGNRMFLSFATILLAWHGIRMMLAWRQSGEHMFSFAKLLLIIAFGYAMIAYYESPIPGIGDVVLEPHHRPDGLPGEPHQRPVGPERAAEPEHALERARAAGRLVDPRQPALLD